MPRGGSRPNSGRKKGSKNKRPRDFLLSQLAQRFTVEALGTLVWLARTARSGRTRVLAANLILDRGWGKVRQGTAPDNSRGRFSGYTRDDVVYPTTDDLCEQYMRRGFRPSMFREIADDLEKWQQSRETANWGDRSSVGTLDKSH
jgi:hypothetical protein